jgi:hypothetical protein
MHDPCGDNATATAGARMVGAFDKDQQARHQHTATTANVVNTQSWVQYVPYHSNQVLHVLHE